MDFEDEKIVNSYACWFVNTFWNDVYGDASVNAREIDNGSIAENYKNILMTFNQSFKSDMPMERKHDTPYGIIMETICKYYNAKCHRNKDVREFIKHTARIIVGEYEMREQQLTYEELDNITKQVIRTILSQFITYILSGYLNIICTKDKAIPNEWYQKFLLIFNTQVEKYQHYIIALRNGVDIANGQEVEMVQLSVADALKDKIKELLYDIETLKLEYNQLVRYTKVLKEKLRNVRVVDTINLHEIVSDGDSDVGITYDISDDINISDDSLSGDILSYDS